jgi:hypothetical protein
MTHYRLLLYCAWSAVWTHVEDEGLQSERWVTQIPVCRKLLYVYVYLKWKLYTIFDVLEAISHCPVTAMLHASLTSSGKL